MSDAAQLAPSRHRSNDRDSPSCVACGQSWPCSWEIIENGGGSTKKEIEYCTNINHAEDYVEQVEAEGVWELYCWKCFMFFEDDPTVVHMLYENDWGVNKCMVCESVWPCDIQVQRDLVQTENRKELSERQAELLGVWEEQPAASLWVMIEWNPATTENLHIVEWTSDPEEAETFAEIADQEGYWFVELPNEAE